MNLVVFLISLSFLLSITMGMYVFVRKRGAAANRIFVIYCLANALWYFCLMFQLSARTVEEAEFWFIQGLNFCMLSLPIFSHFVVALVERKAWHRKVWVAALLYLPIAYFVYRNSTDHVFPHRMIETTLGWSSVQDNKSPWTIIGYVNTLIYALPSCVLLVRWGHLSADFRRRRQMRIMIGALCFGIGLYSVSAYLAGQSGLEHLSAISPLFTMIWLLGIGYATGRYRLMGISPAEAAYSIYTTMADGVLLLDTESRIVNANPASYEILRLRESDLLMRLVEEATPGVFPTEGLKNESEGIIRDRETVFTMRAGAAAYLSFSASILRDGSGNPGGTVLVFRDITERKQTEKRFLHMATHDALTNLPNRVLLNDRLRNAISHAERHHYIIALLLIDLDKFKDVNDQHGHDAGDHMLTEVARRLLGSVREYDTVCRLGGDEFVVLLTDITARHDCDTVIKRIRSAFTAPVKFDDFELLQTLSIGVSLYPQHADNIEALFKFADLALYQVKARGRNDLQYYEGEEDPGVRRTMTIEQDLRMALTTGELELYYQPVYDISSRRMIAMESLVRWNHPKLGLVGPMEFIPYAERCGLIIPLGNWVITQACRQSAAWQASGKEVLITINLSAKQFQDPDLCEKFQRVLAESGATPRLIAVELTESTAINDMQEAVKTTKRLKGLGIDIIIDDFGSGYSSMTWLKYLEAKAVKIDRFFIQNIANSSTDAAIVKAIISLAHSMGMTVIAEGIETEEQLEAIRGLHWDEAPDFTCDHAQGYLFSKPVPAAMAETLLKLSP